ncbi:hypothetical protein MKQ70_32140 [Chitinophaga sedimenti]|uniref:hypothetical protein n=1 Tax=Chitinophaga sedimenti TaxID=2033606 RepID=UPI0020049E6E|nr:hypothetical protein [Chitinophaga sedimenti]MCK7559369.1 hypothetical protein [Chitinophaga sedimenti]
MENVSLFVVGTAYDYVVMPKDWKKLWDKAKEYRKNKTAFDDDLIDREIAHQDHMAGLLEIFDGGINVYRRAAGQTDFESYTPAATQTGPSVHNPCN